MSNSTWYGQTTFNVLQFDAIGDGQTDDSEVSFSICRVCIFVSFVINNEGFELENSSDIKKRNITKLILS